MKKLSLIAIAFIFFSFKGENWETIYSEHNVTIKFKEADCILDNSFKQRWFLLSLHNSSTAKVNVQWDLELYDENKKCVTCNGNEKSYALTLLPGETKEGECSFKTANELRVVSKLLDVKSSTSYPDFKLTNITITKID